MPGTVTVACKIPNGLILRNFVMVPKQEMVMGGGVRETTEACEVGEPIRINGPGRLDRPGPGRPNASGYALTFGVDADMWDVWLAANKDTAYVRNRMIFAHAKTNEVSAEARDNEARRSGLEPMDPQGDERSPRKRKEVRVGAISALETASKAA